MRYFKYLSFIYLILLASASRASVLPIEVYGSLPQTSKVSISPDGSKVAFRKTSDDKDMVVVYDFAQKKPIAGVDVSEIKPKRIYFVSNDNLILVVEKHQKLAGYRGTHDMSAAYSYNIKTKKIFQLLRAGEGIYKGQTRLGEITAISSDGKYAYMPAYLSQGSRSLMKVRLDKRAKPRVFKRGTGDVIDFFVKGDEVLARERFNDRRNLHLVEVYDDGNWREIFREETEIRHRSFVGFTSDHQHLVMKAENEYGRWGYYTMALADGKVSEPVFSHKDKDIEVMYTDVNRVVHGVRYSGFKPSYDFFDAKIQKQVNDTVAAAPDDSVYLYDYMPDWSQQVYLMAGNTSAGEFYLAKNGQFQFLTAMYPDVKTEQIHQILATQIKARDGLKIPVLLTIPNVENFSNLPAIMMPHGGPESYDKIDFDYQAQYFASRGYLVIQPQFRGSDGFGAEFMFAGRGEWGRKMQDDLTDTVKTLVKSGYVDKDKVCIVGASYGGYAALAGATFSPDVYQCAVSINGVADIPAMIKDKKFDYGSDHWVISYWQNVIGDGEFEETHLDKISPINHVNKVKIPVLLVHGTEDTIVPFDQSDDMYDELKDAKKNVQFVELKKGDHHLSKGVNRMKALKAIDAFVSKHI